MARTLVLVGGGHSHIQIVASLASWPRDVRRVLISDAPVAVYSGMIPSVISGLIPPTNAEVNLRSLAARGGWEYIEGRVTGFSGARRIVHYELNERPSAREQNIAYSVLSVDVGSTSKPFVSRQDQACDAKSIPTIIATRPIARILVQIEDFEARRIECNTVNVCVIGAGAAGVELAFCIDARFRQTLPASKTRVALIDGSKDLSARLGPAAPLVSAEMRDRDVEVWLGSKACNAMGREIVLENGRRIPADLIVTATGAAAHEWLSLDTDISTDIEGFLTVSPSLQSRSFPNIFASGDCCSFDGYFGVSFPPRAGVYAVRMGPILEHNIRELLSRGENEIDGSRLKWFSPQPSFLSLLTTGEGSAIGSKWNIAIRGRWVYKLKVFIDESWQSKFKQGQVSWISATLPEFDVLFPGTPFEAAAVLFGTDPLQEDFKVQNSILCRMDAEEEFRATVISSARIN
jgi:selenide, water dikinase